jgi:hypothetical protein
MEILGYVFVVVLALLVMGALALTLTELGSINRYRRIRRM